MATLALGAAGAVAGGALLPGGVSLFGASVSGAAIGRAVGAVAGSFVDSALFGASGQTRVEDGPRLADLKVSASTEGVPIPRMYGRVRLPGHMIWATRFEEEIITTTQTSGGNAGSGKGFGNAFGSGSSGSAAETVTSIEYRYYANVAYAVAEGEITRIGRIWADGKEVNQSDFTIRVYTGSETQTPDSLIEAKQGAGLAPAYRGTAYVVLERLPLARFGNRLPQLNFEVFRAVDGFEKIVRAVDLIPSAGEFVYETGEVVRVEGGATIPENVHAREGGTDWTVSLNQLQDQLPNVGRAALVVSWFGDDLRIGSCTLRPKVEVGTKTTTPDEWSVAGVSRGSAQVVSQVDGAPAFGGTPSDKAVVSAIKDLTARGLGVMFYPFILMDVPAGNALPDPYSDNAGSTGQPVYPWRGRITASPAAGFAGSPDKSAAALSQVASLIGTAAVSDFAISGESVLYSGPAEWTLRRMILHYAHLCKAAGGVDTFLIGSEMRGATQVRSAAGTYPFVDALVTLAADVKSVLGSGTKVSYAADWAEYFGHQPSDGTNDVYFHLDPLWSSADVDAVCIDNYWPLTDWRDGNAHLDAVAGASSIYDLAYLKGNIAGGEGYDWFYVSQADRDSQTRTTISDSTYGKPWVFRYKDIKSWWQNPHYNRPGGVESGSPTAWVAESKPIWFTELGCPAVDKGPNQPNVFFDPKSSESVLPYYSRGVRDDLVQRRYIQAVYEFFDPAHEDYVAGANPTSGVYGGRMVDVDRIHVWTWDARPYPAFPFAIDVWSDGGNWEFGHWLNGRMAGGPLAAVVGKIMEDYGFTAVSVGGLTGNMDGYVIDRIMSARQALQPLELAYFFDAYESAGLIQFAHRGRAGPLIELTPDDLVETGPDEARYSLTRGQETELPVSAKLTYIDGSVDYRQAAVEARRLAVHSARVSTADLPIAMGQAQAQAIAESWLQDAWAARERGTFQLPPSLMRFEPTDVVTLKTATRDFTLRMTATGDALAKSVEALSIEPELYVGLRTPQRTAQQPAAPVFGAAIARFLDLPILRQGQSGETGFVAAYQAPWPGAVAFYRSPSDTGFVLNALATAQAALGVTEWDFYSGPVWRYDRGNQLRVKLDNGTLESIDELTLLGGGNAAALQNGDGEWEVLQFQNAALVSPGVYDLTVFLRGQAGTEGAMRDPVSAGAPFVFLDSAVVPVSMTSADIELAYNWKFGPSNRDISDNAYSDAVHAFAGIGLRPYAPVHLDAINTAGNWVLSWVRRTRFDGDSWVPPTVPLNEDAEEYEIEILDGTNVVRTVSGLGAPAWDYVTADQIADFGSLQSSLAYRVYQMSARYGRGAPGSYPS